MHANALRLPDKGEGMFRFRSTWEAPGFVTIPKEGPPKLIFFLKEITRRRWAGKKLDVHAKERSGSGRNSTRHPEICQKARCQFTQMDLRNRDNLGNHHSRQDMVSPL